MIRVMHVVLGMDIGGLEAFVAGLCATYAGSVESIVVCLRGDGTTIRTMPEAQVINMDGPERFSWRQVLALVSLIREENIDIVHTHNPGPHLYGAIAGRLARRPVIHTKHGRNYPKERRKVWLNRVATLFTDRVVAVSRDAEQVCRDVERIAPSKLLTILNGIDTGRFVPRPPSGRLRQELGIDPDIPIVGIVARLSRVKNHPLLFDSMRELKRRRVPVALCVAGDGPQGEALQALVDELDLRDTVFFVGARSQTESLYPEFDVFVLTSSSEGVSLTLLEAMSCEKPVVATRVGGNPEVIDDGVTGVLVAEEAQDIADAIHALLSGREAAEKRNRLGKHGRERVKAHFSMDRTAAAYLREYNRLVANDHSGTEGSRSWKSP